MVIILLIFSENHGRAQCVQVQCTLTIFTHSHLNITLGPSTKEKLEKIDKYVFAKFEEARQKRLPVKDANLQEWAMEENRIVRKIKLFSWLENMSYNRSILIDCDTVV